MATVNLGLIKFRWQGAYAGGTAYVKDDVVSYNGSSYVCILASTGNLPTNTTYWNLMSSAGTNGTNGTNGTDLTTTLTTQGDIVYRDASGLARLGAGTSGQVLQTGGSGANPSWTTMSSDVVKIHHTTTSSATTELVVADCFSNTYKYYQINVALKTGDSGADIQFRWLSGSGSTTQHNNNDYFGGLGGGEFVNSGGQNFDQALNTTGSDGARLTGAGNNLGNLATPNNYQLLATIKTYNPHSSNRAKIFGQSVYTGQSESNTRYMVDIFGYEYRSSDSTNMTGFKLMSSTGNGIATGTAVSVYGFKE